MLARSRVGHVHAGPREEQPPREDDHGTERRHDDDPIVARDPLDGPVHVRAMVRAQSQHGWLLIASGQRPCPNAGEK